MKEYSLQEVISIIENGEEYRSDSPLWEIKSIKKVNGNINFIYNGTKNDSVGVNANQRFIKVEQPVSFMDVVNSNKKCRVEHDFLKDSVWYNDYKEFEDMLYDLGKCYASVDIKKVILEGKWYLED